MAFVLTDCWAGAYAGWVELESVVVVVTGGASGMGRATAELMAERGASVVVVDINAALANEVAAEVGGTAIVGSVTDPAFCQAAVATVVQANGHIDVLVNAAGVIVRQPAAETSDQQWRRVFDVNVNGTFYMSRAAVQHMAARQSGSIVNFGSVWGEVGAAGQAAYAASKGAVHQLTRTMALEHSRDGVRINAVAPGEIRTPMLASERETPLTEADLAGLADRTVPMGRLGDSQEVAEVVAFLASDRASYMTGSIVAVDAGYLAQ